MQRRNFIKFTGVTSIITLVNSRSIANTLGNLPAMDLEADFRSPPSSAKAYTWWHWMNGNITKEGITLDLEAMKEAGLGGFQMFDAGTGIVKGPVEYLSAEWVDLVKHAISESRRLKLEFAMHNCPGWSSSGGPWITPELSMQQVTWSEIVIEGGRDIKLQLPKPAHSLNYYKDAVTIAFPSIKEEEPIQNLIKSVRTNNSEIDINRFIGIETGGIDLKPGGDKEKGFLLVEFNTPQPVSSLVLNSYVPNGSRGGNAFVLEYSADGKNFTKITDIRVGEEQALSMPLNQLTYLPFAKITAKYYRLVSDKERHISSLYFSTDAKFDSWMIKANYRNSEGSLESESKEGTENIQAINPKDVIDVSAFVNADGSFNWKAPAGKWTILRIGHTAVGQLNHSAPTTGTGLDCDKFSVAAFDFHFNTMFKNLLPAMKEIARDVKVGLLIDSYEMGLQNWTTEFPKEFEKRNKYSIISYLPAMTGRVVGNDDETNRFLYDVRRTQANMMADYYYGRFHELCKDNSFISYTEPYGFGNLDELQAGSRVDINMGEFWSGITNLWNNAEMKRTLKLASSIAHVAGQSIVGAEAFTAEPGSGKWQQYPYSMKALGDKMYTLGLTRFIFHRYAHQPHPTAVPGMTMGPWGIHFERTNTWWKPGKAWLTYIARCQYLLQQGQFVADLLYVVSEQVPVTTKVNRNELSFLPPFGYDYDLINTESLIGLASAKNKRIAFKSGISYTLLVLSDDVNMSMDLLKKLAQLVDDGIILIGNKPIDSFSANKRSDDDEFEKLCNQIWNSGKQNVIPFSKAKGSIQDATENTALLKKLNIEPDFTFTSASGDAPVNYIHRLIGEKDIYFVANQRRQKENIVCSFRIANKQPQIWNPDTGEIIPVLVYEVEKGYIKIPLQLDESGSVFIVFSNGNTGSYLTSIIKGSKQVVNTINYPEAKTGIYTNVKNNFVISFHVKPEVDIALSSEAFFGKTRTEHYAIFPVSGNQLYGNDHATVGITIGRNGIMVFEHANEITDVLSVPVSLSGWTYFSLVYTDATPSVYLNGKLIKQGKKSRYTVHPTYGEARQAEGATFYNGDMTTPQIGTKTFLENQAGQTVKSIPVYTFDKEVSEYNKGLLFWNNGTYNIINFEKKQRVIKIDKAGKPKAVTGPWRLAFSSSAAVPQPITLNKLIPLNQHSLDNVKYFSGTVTYSNEFTILATEIIKGREFFVDLGRVEVIAGVKINGMDAGTLWKPPFMVNITRFVKAGANRLEVSVTNLWPNRLIGDEQMPEENEYEKAGWPGKFAILGTGAIKKLPDWYVKGVPKPRGGRSTFSTWKHYSKDSPLLESGLIGPVLLRTAMLVNPF